MNDLSEDVMILSSQKIVPYTYVVIYSLICVALVLFIATQCVERSGHLHMLQYVTGFVLIFATVLIGYIGYIYLGYQEYQVLVSENVSLKDFNETYRIVGEKGCTYIVVEK